ncbi:MAG TPA: ABC transporter permease [Trinickia sp.]|jgi:putative ABC transport system permease protein|uniref:ABC transporter permease n=1 Tax=Trinickia sp. TaxID=2571163 RepID=UPI002C184144|nr:ABC transporter permease [Trinickia sp.]HTI17638.1 ABC transporter permease [Trinickia sp.]
MIQQIVAVTIMNLRSLPQRIGTAWVIVIGIAVTVAVMISVLAMAEGFTQTLKGTARVDRALVLRAGSEAELASTISRENTQTIMDAPGIQKNSAGRPIASAEAVVIVALPQKKDGADANVTLRGVGANARALRPEARLIAGRMYRPAVREIIVGKSAVAQFKGLDLGSRIAFRDSEWTVVGIFESGGDAHESELQGDVETVLSAYRRNLFQSVSVMLESPQAFDRFKAALTTDPTLKVSVERETNYYAAQSRNLSKLLNLLAYFVGGIMALGACFGALNTMYTAVSTRTREIATLRAIGFGGLPIVISVLAEAMLLALIGSVMGSAAAWLFFDGNTVNTLAAGFTQVVFHLTVTAPLVAAGVIMACLVGMLGGLMPAIRAAQLPIAVALRAS